MYRNSFDNPCLPLQKTVDEFSRAVDNSLYARSAHNSFDSLHVCQWCGGPHMTNQCYPPESIGYEAMMYQQQQDDFPHSNSSYYLQKQNFSIEPYSWQCDNNFSIEIDQP